MENGSEGRRLTSTCSCTAGTGQLKLAQSIVSRGKLFGFLPLDAPMAPPFCDELAACTHAHSMRYQLEPYTGVVLRSMRASWCCQGGPPRRQRVATSGRYLSSSHRNAKPHTMFPYESLVSDRRIVARGHAARVPGF